MVFQQNALIYYLAGHKLIRKGEGGCRFGKVENPSFSFRLQKYCGTGFWSKIN
jgi:hypothetical protein